MSSTLTAGDRSQILDLYSRWALAIDTGDGSGWADCFTEQGVFTAHRGQGMASRHIAGRPDLDRFAREHRAGPNARTRHQFSNIAARPAPGGAEGRAEILYVEGDSVLGSGLYQDRLVWEEGAWLFARRVVNHERLRP